MSDTLRSPRRPLPVAVLGAAHPGPALAVTLLAGLLSAFTGLGATRTLLVVAAVLTSQLTIGWSNDLLDLRRDREVGRSDKPLASGAVSVGAVRLACAVCLVLTVPLGVVGGPAAFVVHLVNTAAGWAYNLGLKATVWSWAPYAVAFGGLPAFVALAGGGTPAPWAVLAGALLGVGAHLLNVLPDLADDAATGVRGLPHRLGARWTPPVAIALLVLASVLIVVGASVALLPAAVALLVVAALAGTALAGSGRLPFLAAIGIALADVVLLVGAR